MSGFINTYNFIKLPAEKQKAYEESDSHTGVIEYTITTKSPLFIPNTSSDNAFLFGGRVGVCYYRGWNLSVDGIEIKVLRYTTDYPYFGNSFQNVVACLNQMQQLGVDTFLTNYKQSLEKTKDELTVICDKLEGELGVQENEEKAKLLAKLRNVIIEMIVVLFGLMVDVNVGLDNHNYVDAYNEIVNENSVD